MTLKAQLNKNQWVSLGLKNQHFKNIRSIANDDEWCMSLFKTTGCSMTHQSQMKAKWHNCYWFKGKTLFVGCHEAVYCICSSGHPPPQHERTIWCIEVEDWIKNWGGVNCVQIKLSHYSLLSRSAAFTPTIPTTPPIPGNNNAWQGMFHFHKLSAS